MRSCKCNADLAGLALDALASDEARIARQHAANCRACDRVLAEYEEVAAILGTDVALVLPPRGLKTRVLRAAAAQRRATHSMQETSL